jgi:F-type H+-transporting ATPase subunit gamma
MEQLPRIAARIASLSELRDLFRALRALAASHVQEAQAALAGVHRYVEVIEDAIAEGAALLPDARRRLSESYSRGRASLLVVCTEQGFVGAYKERLLDRAQAERQAGEQLCLVGRRGATLAAEQSLEVAWCIPASAHVQGVLAVARQLADRLADASRVRIIHALPRPGGSFEVAVKQLLPLDPALLARVDTGRRPVHHLAIDTLLQRLGGEYLLAELTRALMDGLASENAARLRVMDAADRSCQTKLEALRRRERRVRQDAITEELLDVVTGAEVILSARH